MKYILVLLFSIVLFAFTFYMTLFIAWGRILSVETGFYISLSISIIYFFVNTFFIKQGKQDKKGLISLFFTQLTSVTVIPFATFFIILFIFSLLHNEEDYYKLYKYDNYPCKNVVFSTVNKMHLVAHNHSFMPEGAYFITRNTLEEAHHYMEHGMETENKYIEFYPIGSKWKVIGLYRAYDSISNGLYFLVQSQKDKNLAWIANMDFNYKECKPNFYSYETRFKDYPMYEPDKNSTGKFLNLIKMKMIPY